MIILSLTLFFRGEAQQSMDYSVHANIIYHFTKYIDWPESRKSGDFIIGVVGDSRLFAELEKTTANKKAGNQRIVVMHFSSYQAVYNCHILFLSEEESGSLKKIAARTAGTSLLLVSEKDGGVAREACINFRIVSERLTLEINKNNIAQRHLNIAVELLRLGTIVK